MRPLTEQELKTLVEKLATYCGKGIQNLIADGTADRHVFRIQVCCASLYTHYLD
jgi:60S ribosome subunit biogenesis protein NIP7